MSDDDDNYHSCFISPTFFKIRLWHMRIRSYKSVLFSTRKLFT